MQVESLDLTNKSYEEVDTILHRLAGIPEDVSWSSLHMRGLMGLVPKENTQKFYDLVKKHEIRHNRIPNDNLIKSNCKYFRLSISLNRYFILISKVIQMYVYGTIRVFMINDYGSVDVINYYTELMWDLSRCFKECKVTIYSITKDEHDGHRSRGTPFRRPYVVMMVVSE